MEFAVNEGKFIFKYKSSKKEEAFKYIVYQIINWWIKENKNVDFAENNLGKLKVMKLLFFTVSSSSNRNDSGLLKIFNNWHALPYGHVEKDIMNLFEYRKGDFGWFIIDQEKITLKKGD